MYIPYTLLLLINNIKATFCQETYEPTFQPISDELMMMLYKDTLVEKMTHISTVTLTSVINAVETRTLAVANKTYTEVFQDSDEITIYQPLNVSGGLLVKMDPCTPSPLYYRVNCVVGASIGLKFHYIPLNYIQSDLDNWICLQNDTSIWMNTAGSTNFHVKKCIRHVNLFQHGQSNKLQDGWNRVWVDTISQTKVHLSITLPDCTETVAVSLSKCNVSIVRKEQDVNHWTISNEEISDAKLEDYVNKLNDNESFHENATQNTVDDARKILEGTGELLSVLNEVEPRESPNSGLFIWIGVSSGAAVIFIAIIIMISQKIRNLQTINGKTEIDSNPDYGEEAYEYYRRTELCDSNEVYYQQS